MALQVTTNRSGDSLTRAGSFTAFTKASLLPPCSSVIDTRMSCAQFFP